MSTSSPNSIWPRAAIGILTGAVIGVAASFASVFHWEMAGFFVIAFSTGAGLIGGACSARRGFVLGGLAGSLSFGILIAVVAISLAPFRRSPLRLWELPVWGTVVVVVAAFVGSVGRDTASKILTSLKRHYTKLIVGVLFFAAAYVIWWVVPVMPRVTLTGNGLHELVGFSSDSRILATTDGDAGPKLWHADTGGEITGEAKSKLAGKLSGLSPPYSPDGRFCITPDSEYQFCFELWDVATGTVVHRFSAQSTNPYGTRWSFLAFASNSQTLVFQNRGGGMFVWDLPTGKSRFVIDWAEAFALSPDGKILAVVPSPKKQAEVRGEAKRQIPRIIKLWDVDKGEELSTLAGHDLQINALAFSADGKTVASVTASFMSTKPVHWNPTKKVMERHKVFQLKLWDVARGSELASVNPLAPLGQGADHITLAGSTLIAQGGTTQWKKVWDISALPPRELIHFADSRQAVSPDGRLLARLNSSTAKYLVFRGFDVPLYESTTFEHLELLDLPTMQRRRIYPMEQGRIVFSPDSRLLAMARRDIANEVRLFDLQTGRSQGSVPYSYFIMFSPDGKTFATTTFDGESVSQIKLWNLPVRKPIWVILGGWFLLLLLFIAVGMWRNSRGQRKSSLSTREAADPF